MTVSEVQSMNPDIKKSSVLFAGEQVCVKSFCQAPYVELTVKAGDTIEDLVNYFDWSLEAFEATNPNVSINSAPLPGKKLCFNKNHKGTIIAI